MANIAATNVCWNRTANLGGNMDNSKAKAEDVTCNINFDKEIALKLFNDESMLWSRDFRPSTSIAHAMEVEAKMFRRGQQVNIIRGQPSGVFRVWFTGHKVKSSESLPEAICRAALAALEE